MVQKMAATIPAIEARLNDVDGLVKSIGVRNAGSLLRISQDAYPNWLMEVNNSTKEFLESNASDAYLVEWQPTDDRLNALVATASKRAGLGDVNANMCERIGALTADGYKPSTIIDLGTGTGHPSFEIYSKLQAEGLRAGDYDRIILNDASEKRLPIAVENIRGMDFWQLSKYSVYGEPGQDIDVLRMLPTASINVVVSNAAIHHHSDNNHLDTIYTVLAPGGVLRNGDWHEGVWEKPARAYWMFAILREDRLGNRELGSRMLESIRETGAAYTYDSYSERPELKAFRKYFGLQPYDVQTAFSPVHGPKDERLADVGIMNFWRSVDTIFSEAGEVPPIQMFEAHETVYQRTNNLAKAGFVIVGRERINTGYGELATVITAMKIRK